MLLGALPPSLARAQQAIPLSDSLRADTEELPVRWGGWSGPMQGYRFGDYFVLSREGGWVRGDRLRRRGPRRHRRAVAVSRLTFQYAVKGPDSTRVGVSVRRTWLIELRRPSIIGAWFGDPGDTVGTVDSTSAVIVFEEDTAAAWTVTMFERSGTEVPEDDRFGGAISSGVRIIRLVPARGPPPPKRSGVKGFFDPGRSAYGFVFEEEGRAIAAEQFELTGGDDQNSRVWMPKSATARERIEFAAMFTAVLTPAYHPSPPRVPANP